MFRYSLQKYGWKPKNNFDDAFESTYKDFLKKIDMKIKKKFQFKILLPKKTKLLLSIT